MQLPQGEARAFCAIMRHSLTQLSLLDNSADESLDRFTRLATNLLAAKVALVSVIDDENDRQFFASAQGLPDPVCRTRETPLSHSFCKHVFASGAPLIVSDSRKNPLVADNPAVDELDVIAYAGFPIYAADNTQVGTFCAIDTQPRDWSAQDLNVLKDLAASVSDQIKLRGIIIDNKAARRVSRKFGRIVENAGHEVFTFDAKTLKFINVNKGACRNLGYDLAQLQTMTPVDIKPEFDAAKFRRLIAPLLSGAKDLLEFTTLHKRRDHSTYPVSIRLELHRHSEGDLFVAFCEDITERQRLEKALQKQANSLEALFTHAPDPITISDMDTTILQSNPANERLFDHPGRSSVGTNFFEHIPKENQAQFKEGLSACTPQAPYFSLLQRQNFDGSEKMLMWTNIVQFEGTTPVQLFSVANDVTDLHAAKELAEIREGEAKQASEVRRVFLANMSHEVRTPLNAIMGLFQLIQMADIPERQKEQATVGLNASHHLLGQLINVLEISRVEANAITIRPIETEIAPLAQQWLQTSHATSHRLGKPIKITLDLDPATPDTWMLDPQRVTQIVNNLIDNALKFTEEGRVEIAIKPLPAQGKSDAAQLEIRVSDTGCGIPKDQLDGLFDRFVQVDNTLTREHGGSGLGLAISHELCNLIGGTLEVVPVKPGSDFSTVFALRLET